MRFTRLLGPALVTLALTVLLAPAAQAQPPLRLSGYVTDEAQALSNSAAAEVSAALDRLYTDRRTRLWVVYVDTFSSSSPVDWARATMRASDFGDRDAILAVATEDRAYALLAPPAAARGTDVDAVRRDAVEPALRRGDWAGAALAAADGLNTPPASSAATITWFGLLVMLAIIAVAVLLLWLWSRRRRRRRRKAEFAAARRVDPADPNALAAVPIDALDDLSKAIVVDVDNAVRTSDSELTLAVEEFGTTQTEPFTRAVTNAKATLAQAFNVRQVLDDAVPESPRQRRELLTRVVVAAARADRELDAQSQAFDALRDLLITAPTRLDSLTQQMVDVSARIEPSQRTLAALGQQFDAAALVSVTGNVDTAKQRLAFADQNITTGRQLVSRPAGQQMGLVDAIRAAESALGQARALLDAIDNAGTDINRAVAALPAAIADIENGIEQAGDALQHGDTASRVALGDARDAAVAAAAEAKGGSTDPLGAFTRLTKADADLDRLLAGVAAERDATERLTRTFEQALFAAQSRVRGVSDFIDTRRGSVGPEARTQLAEAVRQLSAAQDAKSTNLNDAIGYANDAAALAAQAQALANADVQSVQQPYAGQPGGSDMGAVIGGIIIGSMLGGGFRGLGGNIGGLGGVFGGGLGAGRSTSFGGSSRSSGRDYSGGGGRF